MNMDLKRVVGEYSNEFLLDQYFHCADHYIAEALEAMKAEIEQRGISAEEIARVKDGPAVQEPTGGVRYAKDDFVPLGAAVLLGDLFAFQAILTEHKIPFLAGSLDTSSSMIPIDTDTSRRSFVVSAPRELHDAATAAIAEHFDISEQYYKVKHSGFEDRLRSFSFHELLLSEAELEG
jgi:hypothetical protein